MAPGDAPSSEAMPPATRDVPIDERAPLHFLAIRRRLGSAVGGNAALTAGLVIVGVMIALGLLAGVISSHGPATQEIDNVLASPGSPGHLLGTDQLGRDTLARLLYGARNDILIAIAAIIIPFVVGTALGCLAGYRGGWLDSLLVGVIDVVIAFPILVLLIALVFVLGPGVKTIIVSVALIDWVVYARLARAAVRHERVMDYVLAAQIGGIPTRRIILRHVFPNFISQSIVYAMSDIVLVILFVTTLGYLGLGIPAPAADWGTMIAEAQPYISTEWWLAVLPGVAIMITGLGLSLIADGLAHKLDVR